MRFNRKAVLAAAVSAALISSGKPAFATPLDPNAFASLGTLSLSSGSITINTTTGQITGAVNLNGSFFAQGAGNPLVAVFDFSAVSIGAGVSLNIVGTNPLAILSRNDLTIAPAINLSGGNATIPSGGAGGAAGGFAGGDSGFSNNTGHGPGGGSGFGNPHDGGGGAHGGAGGAGFEQAVGGTGYGDLNSLLTGGSGGAGGAGSVADGGGGGGGGAIELGSLGFMSLGGVFANGGTGGGDESTYDGGGGAGGGVLLHSAGIVVGSIGANGGAGAPFGGGGGGGRFTVIGSTYTGAGANANLAALASVVNGGSSEQAQSGIAGVASLRPDMINIGSGESVNVGITNGQTGRTDARTEMLPTNITISSGGTSTIISPVTWSGGSVALTGGAFNVDNNTTFSTGANLNWTSGALNIASGKTLAFDGGTGTFAVGIGLSDGATLLVKNSGRLIVTSFFDVGSSGTGGAIGTLSVDGPNAAFLAGNGNGTSYTDIGLNPGDAGTVSFSNSSVGTYTSGINMAGNMGAATLSVSSNAKLTVDQFLDTGPGVSVIDVAGGMLTSTGATNINNHATVNLSDGTLSLSNGTFIGSNAVLNWTGGVLGANTHLTFDGGVGSVSLARGLPDGATLAIIGGGSFTSSNYFDVGSSIDAGNGPVGTLLVSGAGSRLAIHGAVSSAWGGLPGDSATVTFSSGASGTIDYLDIAYAGGHSLLTISGSSTLTVNSQLAVGNAATSAGTVNVAGGTLVANASLLGHGALINYSAGSFNAGTLTMSDNAKVLLTPGGSKVLRAGALSFSGTSKIDLADNDMIVDYTGASPLSAVRGFIITGRNGGNWAGNAITSASAQSDPTHKGLGIAEASGLFGAGGGTFSGQAVDATSVLVKFTYLGDTNLDGKVDIVDLGKLAGKWQQSGAWTDGDANYDGTINIVDLGLLAGNWQAGVGSPLGEPAFADALVALGLPNVSVPEPSILGSLALGAAALAASFQRRVRRTIDR